MFAMLRAQFESFCVDSLIVVAPNARILFAGIGIVIILYYSYKDAGKTGGRY